MQLTILKTNRMMGIGMNTSITQFGLALLHQTQLIANMTENTIANTVALVLVAYSI